MGSDSKGKKGNRRGVALVMVLTVMSLSTIMILTFFSMATSENRSAVTYSRGLQAQQISEQAINLVIAQIRKATANPAIAWASQPGAIRTWDSRGQFNKAYKLYSDDLLDEPDEDSFHQTDFDEAQNWSERPEEFVDLNEPVIRGEKVYFPIVDPIARDQPAWPKKIGGDSDDAGVEGFDFNWDEDHTLPPGPLDGLVRGRNDVGHLPMPVRWIYQLQDGSLGVMKNGQFESFEGNKQPSEKNKIVARFAFWADDETTKLNLNTHAGGLAWDTPKAGGVTDMNMGKYQPAQREWQRYPGHPATTHLSPALAPGVIDIVRKKNAMEMIYSVVPRVVGGGSEAGTRKSDPRIQAERNGLIADTNPLYPSVDEYMLAPDRDANQFPTADARPLAEEEMQEAMERLRFFLTVTSRAPETTLFNTPKICVWPIHERKPGETGYENYHTAFDKLMRFCSSIGEENGEPIEYIIRRGNADSATYDYNNISNNRDIYRFLERYTSRSIPGVGRSFSSKYSNNDRLQLLTQIFDYIRCTNLHDDTLYQEDWMEAFQTTNTSNHRTFTNPRARNQRREEIGQNGIHPGHGQVTPIRINYNGVDTKGFGRFYTLKDVGIITIACAQGPDRENPGPNDLAHFQGGSSGDIYPGFTVYGGGLQEVVEGQQASNFPPMHYDLNQLSGGLQGVLDNKNDYPNWLTQYLNAHSDTIFGIASTNTGSPYEWERRYNGRVTEPQLWREVTEFIKPAFDPANWNYNLLYRLPNYPEVNADGPVPFQQWWQNNRNILRTNTDIRLKPGEIMVQAALIFHMFTPSNGWVPISPDMSIRIEMDDSFEFASLDGRGLFLSNYDYTGGNLPGDDRFWWFNNRRQTSWHDRHSGGVKPMSYMMSSENNPGRHTPLDPGYESQEPYNQYHWVTAPFLADASVLNGSETDLRMTGGDIEFRIYAGGSQNQRSATQVSGPELVQTIRLEMPDFAVPPPKLAAGRPGWINEFGGRHPARPPVSFWSMGLQAGFPHYSHGVDRAKNGRFDRINSHRGRFLTDQDVCQSVGVLHGDVRMIAVQPEIDMGSSSPASTLDFFGPHFNYGNPDGLGRDNDKSRLAHDMALSTGWRYEGASGRQGWSESEELALLKDINWGSRTPAFPIGDPNDYAREKVQKYGDFDNGMGLIVDGPYINKPDEGNTHSLFNRTDPRAAPNAWDMRRDFGDFPYFVRLYQHEAGSPSYFSPNRITNGPGMFGSLPTGARSNYPWRTLLFRPDAWSNSNELESHPGAEDPKDHYLMDLFWMPVVEPYAISDPMSTAGRVNLNYQLMPFRHVKRSTAMRGVLRSEVLLLVPTPGNTKNSRSLYSRSYKVGAGRGRGYHWRDNPNGGELEGLSLRGVILEEATLKQFQARFDDGEIFKSASEICDIHLVPQQMADRMSISASSRFRLKTETPFVTSNGKVPEMESGDFWIEHAVVGDNGRERPYSNIYQRVTTKSNTFKVHYWAQMIKQGRRNTSSEYSKFDPEMDSVVGQYRGSSVVERFIDPTDTRIPNYLTTDNPPSIGQFYQFRVVNATRFAP